VVNLGISVITSEGECQKFSPKRIYNTLIEETGIEKDYAKNVTRRVVRKIHDLDLNQVTTTKIRTLVTASLLKDGSLEEGDKYERIGIPVRTIEKLVFEGTRDNSNLLFSPETSHKIIADSVGKQYALRHMFPEHISNSHIKGEIHLSDLDYAFDRPLNCLTQSPQDIIRYGLKVDGSGKFCTVAGPAKRLSTLVNHVGQALQAAQTNMAGGQSLALWNVMFAPFIKGMPRDEVKQNIQAMVFQFCMSFVSRGSQPIFSSVNTEFTVPNFMRDLPAYGPEGKKVGVYGDYEEETRLLNQIYTEVMLEGDYDGRPHRFPNSIWVLRKEMMTPEFEDDLLKVHELSAKHSLPYFLNLLPDDGIEHASVLGCRSRLNSNWTGDEFRDTFTGNATYNTINLNRIALKSGDEEEYFEELNSMINWIREASYIRRDHSEKLLKNGNMPYLIQEIEGKPYYNLNDATLAIGYCGLNEALVNLGIEGGIVSPEGDKLGVKIITELNNYAKIFGEEDGYRWSVLGTPMESGAGRFAELDLKHYPNSFVQGTKSAPYLSNSCHTPVNSDITILEKIKIEEKYFPLTLGGLISNLYLGESYPNPEALMSLTKRISETNTGFWAYTSIHNHCYDCGFNGRGLVNNCSNCNSTDVMSQSRITGYMSTISQNTLSGAGWNKSKISELHDRRTYDL
jgi:ribonucleoside-triphosphate reductase